MEKAELISFLHDEEGWDRDEILTDSVLEILEDAGAPTMGADELSVSDEGREIMVLQDFADRLFEKILDGICNVIATA
ncbi:hypothetical protein SDC9_186584 [bioreactor metagenome]|uniref:Uncharacterized protein n=1 Tax=bioreactor metagenome TaxID=1076179 RepID=A0A645HJ68_9ZZZZ